MIRGHLRPIGDKGYEHLYCRHVISFDTRALFCACIPKEVTATLLQAFKGCFRDSGLFLPPSPCSAREMLSYCGQV